MHYILVLILVLCNSEFLYSQISTPVFFKEQPFDVISYDVALTFPSPPKTEVINAVCDIRFVWLQKPEGNSFPFHLRDLIVDSVLYEGNLSPFTAQSSIDSDTFHYSVPALPISKAGDTVSLRVYYHGNMGNEPAKPMSWGGVYGTKRILYALGVGFYANYISTTQHWLASYDHPSDKAQFRGSFTVPKGLFVCSNGELQSIDTVGNSLRYTWKTTIPTSTYLLTFAVDSFKQYTFGDEHTIVYALAQDSLATKISFRLLPKMLSTLERYYGKYPFEKVGYVLTPTGSMEHQTMISIDESIVRKKDTVNAVALHELAHQWFGDLVSPKDFRYAWLTESFATFSESLWAAEIKTNGYILDQQAKLSEYLNSSVGREGVLSLDNFSRMVPSSNYPRTIYIKGAIVLGMLRFELGDSVFFASLREYLDTHRFSNATTEDLRSSIERISGRDMKWFFEQWVQRKGWPRFSIDTNSTMKPEGRSLTIHAKQVQPQEYGIFVNVPLEIGFRLLDNSMIYKVVSIANADTVLRIDSLPPYKSMTLNQGPSLRALLQIASVTGIDFQGEFIQDSVRIYPNPGEDIITVEYPLDMEGPIHFSIVDTKGTSVYSWTEQSMHKGNAVTSLSYIQASNLPSGTYTVIVKTGKRTFSTHCVISK